jgi:hexokinase
MTDKIRDFLRAHRLDADGIDTDTVLTDFRTEMDKGLAGKDSSLKMIPTFVTTDNDLPRNKPVIVIDAGGTNLRIALMHFSDSGKAVIDEISKYRMPGAEKELSAAEFFATLTEYLKPIITKSDRIGFCFSYPAEISSDRDGRLIHWTKDIKVPELEGQYIGKGLLAALGEDGKDKKLTLLNDTIATLLAGKAEEADKDHSSYIGLILGTGTNTAYIENNAAITKLENYAEGSQAINVESGGFALAPASEMDRTVDAETINPGEYLFEKMISGLYRGKLILTALKAAAEENLFSEGYAKHIIELDDVDGIHADRFLNNNHEYPLADDSMTDEDENNARDIIKGIYARIAKLTAINITAAVLKSGAGTDPAHPVCINIDGSTYYKSVGFKDMAECCLEEILGSRGISYTLMHVDEAPLIGAAIGGLS